MHRNSRERQKHLRFVALVCRHFHPIARELLLTTPAVHLRDIPQLVRTYLEHPKLCTQAKTLEFATLSFSEDINARVAYNKDFENSINWYSKVESKFKRQCLVFIDAQEVQAKSDWKAHLLGKSCWDIPNAYIALLIALLPNIEELYLGATWQEYFPMLHQCRYGPTMDLKCSHATNPTYLNALFRYLIPKLRTLELPVFDWNEYGTVTDKSAIRSFDASSFTSLRQFAFSTGAISPPPHVARPIHGGLIQASDPYDLLPADIESIILTCVWGHRREIADAWVRDLAEAITNGRFPNLRSIEWYEATSHSMYDDGWRAVALLSKDLKELLPDLHVRMHYASTVVADFGELTHGQAWRYTDAELEEIERRERYYPVDYWKDHRLE